MGKEGKYDLQLASVVSKKEFNDDGHSEGEAVTDNDNCDMDVDTMDQDQMSPLMSLKWAGNAMLQVRKKNLYSFVLYISLLIRSEALCVCFVIHRNPHFYIQNFCLFITGKSQSDREL